MSRSARRRLRWPGLGGALTTSGTTNFTTTWHLANKNTSEKAIIISRVRVRESTTIYVYRLFFFCIFLSGAAAFDQDTAAAGAENEEVNNTENVTENGQEHQKNSEKSKKNKKLKQNQGIKTC